MGSCWKSDGTGKTRNFQGGFFRGKGNRKNTENEKRMRLNRAGNKKKFMIKKVLGNEVEK